MKRALISGVNGQDGSYLAELLLSQGYEVHGTIRRASLPNLDRLNSIRSQISLHWADLSDSTSLARVVEEVVPDEIYNLGAMTDVRVSFDTPEYTADVTGIGALRLLDAVHRTNPEARFYQAGSSEMFGLNPRIPTDENSTFHPASPYAAAKVFAHHAAVNYREAYGMHVSAGILFNHESERRGKEFVTSKIAHAAAMATKDRAFRVQLGNLDAERDWGYAPDYVLAMYFMLQEDTPDDYVIATGKSYTVRQFLTVAFDCVGLDWHNYYELDDTFLRPTDPPILRGNASKASRVLGWAPTVWFEELVERMVHHELELLK